MHLKLELILDWFNYLPHIKDYYVIGHTCTFRNKPSVMLLIADNSKFLGAILSVLLCLLIKILYNQKKMRTEKNKLIMRPGEESVKLMYDTRRTRAQLFAQKKKQFKKQ